MLWWRSIIKHVEDSFLRHFSLSTCVVMFEYYITRSFYRNGEGGHRHGSPESETATSLRTRVATFSPLELMFSTGGRHAASYAVGRMFLIGLIKKANP
jgi:hypothetical protein